MEGDKIVSLYLLRDETAISHTAEKYGSRLRAIAQRITGDSATAEELEQCIPASGDVEQDLDGAELDRAISAFLHGQSKEKRVMFVRRLFC